MVDITGVFNQVLTLVSRVGGWSFSIWGVSFTVFEWFEACLLFAVVIMFIKWLAGFHGGIL